MRNSAGARPDGGGARSHRCDPPRPAGTAVRELWLDDIDLLYAYDGCSFLTLAWLESLGLCGFGEAGQLIAESREPSGTVTLSGRVPLNSHGGGLSEGATQGSGQIREAVQQLRGSAERRQVPDARTALSAMGGLFYNAQAVIFRVG